MKHKMSTYCFNQVPASSSSSIPCTLRSHWEGKASCMRLHSSIFTKVLLRLLSRAQVDTRFRQSGQHMLDLSTVCRKQGLQKVCMQGKVTGSRNMSRQTGHRQSERLRPPELSSTGPVSSPDTGGILWPVSIRQCTRFLSLSGSRAAYDSQLKDKTTATIITYNNCMG